ncbi:metalloendopeptidase [Coemansia javaensis]|uniref:Metalloendopeptidase n=1 Tax=Coemansia javaensis TaxID=2761396 RepID=A0A9W8LIZ9_9FUNG|nr:metalloendopeptidase [Coemansia javaensis]
MLGCLRPAIPGLGCVRQAIPGFGCVRQARLRSARLPGTGSRSRGLQTYRRLGGGQQDPRVRYLAGAAVATGAVYVAWHTGESPTGRWQFISVSVDEERQAGLQAYEEIMRRYWGRIEPRGSAADAMVRRVAQRVIAASGAEGDWEIHVIDSPEKNAFVLPGGKIFVFSGLLPVARTEDGLATVLAHEIAHQYARHTAEKLSQAKLLRLAYIFVALFVDQGMADLGRSVSSLVLELPNSRRCEEEADELGLRFMAMACYDPAQAVGLWQRMKAAERGAPPQFLNTHPSTESRIESIRRWLPEAERAREAAGCVDPGLWHAFSASLGSGQ